MKQQKIQLDNKAWQWAIILFLSLIWGTSFILMKKGLESYSHTQVAAFRIFFSFVFMLPITINNIKVIRRDNIQSLIIVGIIGFAIPAMLFTKAQTRIDSSLAGMLNSLTPLFTLVVGLFFYRSSARWMNVVGLLVGLIGAIGLMWNGDLNILKGINVFALFIVAATICYGININEVKFKLAHLSSLEITSLAFLFTGPIAGTYLLFTDLTPASQTPDYLLNLVYIALLALFSSVIAVLIFNHLIKYTTPLFAASVTYIIPLFAIIWGIIDGESIRLVQLLWIALILVGVYLINK
ncbi:MAG: DMT family transporter [Bacteroidales bacterium]|nr:DMT family transporter [Bacteroidales bacterium]